MAFFGSSWLDEPIDDDSPMFGRNWKDDTYYEYYKDDDGEYKKISTKKELKEAKDNNNIYSFDGTKYERKL